MKIVALTQRVAMDNRTGERRDCLDQRWSEFIVELGALPFALPNTSPSLAADLVNKLKPALVVLTGGNSLARITDSPEPDAAPERDAFEHALIDAAVSQRLPILGVCRGLQLLNIHFGGQLRRVTGHAGVRHRVQTVAGPREVNSYHDWGVGPGDVATVMKPVATDECGGVEALEDPSRGIAAVMWHPERETLRHPDDVALFRRMLWPEH